MRIQLQLTPFILCVLLKYPDCFGELNLIVMVFSFNQSTFAVYHIGCVLL